MSGVALSVIVAAQEARQSIAACLESLLAQGRQGVEIIVVDGSRDGTAELVAERYPAVKLIQREWPCSLPKLLGSGISQARGNIVAITEAHCVFPQGWAEAVLRAHAATSEPAIGGVVEPGDGLNASDWGLYFADYGQFMLPLPPGAAAEMPGENVSFKRAALDTAWGEGLDLARDGFWKTFFCWKLEQAGHTLVNEPSIIIHYHRRVTLPQLLRRRFRHGRCLGGMLAQDRSTARRVVMGLGGWAILPTLLTLRLFRKVWPKGRYRREFLRSLPFALLAIGAWSAGEWWGNLFNTGNSCNYV